MIHPEKHVSELDRFDRPQDPSNFMDKVLQLTFIMGNDLTKS